MLIAVNIEPMIIFIFGGGGGDPKPVQEVLLPPLSASRSLLVSSPGAAISMLVTCAKP